jgi:hypothetical protein
VREIPTVEKPDADHLLIRRCNAAESSRFSRSRAGIADASIRARAAETVRASALEEGIMKFSRLCATLIFALAATPMLGGCIVAADPPPRVAVAAYSPLFYNGYAVYYDDWGYPFYYAGGVAFYVPRTYAHYEVLVSHYRAHPGLYRHEVVRGGVYHGHYARR